MSMMKRLLDEDQSEDRWFVLPVLQLSKDGRKHRYTSKNPTHRLLYRDSNGRCIEVKRGTYDEMNNLANVWNKEERAPPSAPPDSRWIKLAKL